MGQRFLVVLTVLIAIMAFAGLATSGCSKNQSKASDRFDEFVEQDRKFYSAYLQGDSNQSRQALHQAIEFFESSTGITPESRAHFIFFAHARLYALEERTGNEAEAEAAMIKARYWLLKKFQLAKYTTTEAMREVNSFTPEKILQMVDEFDREPRGSERHEHELLKNPDQSSADQQ